MTIEYDTGDWNKKLNEMDAMNLYSNGFKGWDLDGSRPYSVKINGIWECGIDSQKIMICWADDNIGGYFYQHSFSTEGGTPIIRVGDKFSITLAFQKQEDAIAFKLRWI